MPKFFVFGDCHGFYTQLKDALEKAGFDRSNPEHWIISVGDNLDRGREPAEIINFLSEVENKILVRGNHEDLFEDLCMSKIPCTSDYHNGTVQTIADLSKGDSRDLDMFDVAMSKYKPLLSQMKDYFETEHYVFVHSCIEPVNDWRDVTEEEWKDARWGNPFNFWELFAVENKTVVFGHWHTSHYNSPQNEFSPESDFGVACGDGFIGIDGCTAYSGKVNVLVIEDEFLRGGNK